MNAWVALVDQGDAYIALNGGAGTLAEISITWNRLIINSFHRFILLGEAWKQVIQGLFDLQSIYFRPRPGVGEICLHTTGGSATNPKSSGK